MGSDWGMFIRGSVLNPIACVDDGQQDVCLGFEARSGDQTLSERQFLDVLWLLNGFKQYQTTLDTVLIEYVYLQHLHSALPQTIPALEFTIRGLPWCELKEAAV